ncbi:helix-turn-helix domain-containing protein [Pelistega ratti]|nr:helix-turn-helix domain-containing protein [Pelistega ratti]
MGSVEKAMLKKVMEYTNGNQSKTAEILGITRNTLRKKLISNHLINET